MTQISCQQSIEQAIIKLLQHKEYVCHHWLNNSAKWAMWAWQHSLFLLQITLTSPLESYHAILKRMGNGNFGLIGACMIIYEVNASYFIRSTRAQLEFWTKLITEADTYSFLHHFPSPVQTLLVEQIQLFEKHLAEGEPTPNHQTPEC